MQIQEKWWPTKIVDFNPKRKAFESLELYIDQQFHFHQGKPCKSVDNFIHSSQSSYTTLPVIAKRFPEESSRIHSNSGHYKEEFLWPFHSIRNIGQAWCRLIWKFTAILKNILTCIFQKQTVFCKMVDLPIRIHTCSQNEGVLRKNPLWCLINCFILLSNYLKFARQTQGEFDIIKSH